MKKISLLIILGYAFNFSNAQFSLTSKSEAVKIKNSILLVVLEEEDPKTLQKLAKKSEDKLNHYKQQIVGRNYALKNAVGNYWTFSDNVEFKSKTEAGELMKSNKGKYVMIHFGKHLDYESVKTGRGYDGRPAGWNTTTMTYNMSTKYTALANEISTLEIKDSKSLIKVFLPNIYPSEADLIYGIQQLQYILRYLTASPENKMTNFMKHIRSNTPQLKNLVLLVDKNEVENKLNVDAIKELYPYSFELVDDEVIDKAVIEKNPKYAYVQIVETPNGKGNVSSHSIVGAEKGKIYCFIYPKVAIGIKGTSVIKYNERIKLRHFKKYAENITP